MQPGSNHSLPLNLFPDENSADMVYVDTYQPIPSPETGLIIRPGDTTRTERVGPVYVGCLTYVIPISGITHHTSFVYELGTISGAPPTAKATNFRLGRNIPSNELVMMAFPFGGFDAN
jgi:hypothetical protein